MVMIASTSVNIPPKTALSPTIPSKQFSLLAGQTYSLQLRQMPANMSIKNDWKLASDLMIIIRTDETHFIASLSLLNEYGLGVTVEESIDDLLTSLVDYMESLLRREARLSEPLKKDLEILKKLITR